MTPNFQIHHGAMLLKYSGISFISGAVNHGFFSGERSLWTAAAGIVLFILGVWLERRQPGAGDSAASLGSTLVWGTLLSVGLGFFTGGLQHFPDSPDRSAWVVPLGFVLSVVALVAQQRAPLARAAKGYVVIVGLMVTAGSVAAWQWLDDGAPLLHSGHQHGETAGQAGAAPVAQVVGRTIEVSMTDGMRFTPDAIAVQAGETVRLRVSNEGQLPHELVIGSESELTAHRRQMQSGGAHDHHGGGAAITVAPGAVGELVVTYPVSGRLLIACFVPGHYEAGMRGTFDVVAQLAQPSDAAASTALAAPAAKPPKHDHSTHKH